MAEPPLTHLTVGEGAEARNVAVLPREGKAPGIFWLGGFRSDMDGSKAAALDRWAEGAGHAVTRFDYSGHGRSGGRLRGRHDLALAGGGARRLRRIHERAAGAGRLLDGRMDRAAAWQGALPNAARLTGSPAWC